MNPGMENIQKIIKSCYQYKQHHLCCIIAKNMCGDSIAESDLCKNKKLIIRQLCDDSANRIIVLEINDVSKFEK